MDGAEGFFWSFDPGGMPHAFNGNEARVGKKHRPFPCAAVRGAAIFCAVDDQDRSADVCQLLWR